MKKILFSAVNLEVGGIEKALVMLLNNLANIYEENSKQKYELTLVLEEKTGTFINELDAKIKIIEYKPSKLKNVAVRKLFNFVKQRVFRIKHKNKYDFSCSFATYSRPGSFVARTASQNAALWCHMDYLSQYRGDKEKVKEFFEEVKFKEFKKLVFVSEKSRNTFIEVFPEMKDKVIHINNMIDDKKIIQEANENIDLERNEMTFVNVSRQEENQKRISRIIEATKILKDEKLKFRIILVGDGPDSQKYKDEVLMNELDNYVIFVGKKKNPYPYIKVADCMLLTSDYEGSPVAFVEALVLNKPIITTDVAGAEQIEGKFGIVTDKDAKKIAETMRKFIKEGYEVKEKFNANQYNKEIIEKLEAIM